MPASLGPAEIVVILVVALILLGPNRLPEAGRQVGKTLTEVRRWVRDAERELRSAVASEPSALQGTSRIKDSHGAASNPETSAPTIPTGEEQ